MPLARHEDETVLEQRRRVMAGGQGAAESQHQVGVAAREIGRDDVLLEGADLQPDAGRLALQAGQQAGQHGEGHEVVGHDHEVAVGGGRIEGRRAAQALLDGQQGGAHGRTSESARSVGIMPPPCRTSSGSPSSARSCPSALLTAGCERPRRAPARLTLRSVRSASRTGRRFRLTAMIFME